MIVEVLIVSYNSLNVLSRCLDALQQQSVSHSVQIVDNASSDNTSLEIHRRYPHVRMLPLRRNTGFARAVNIGVSRSSADVIITLNPETVPQPDFVQKMTEPFGADQRLASVAGTMVFETRPEVIASAGITVHRNGVAIDSGLGDPVDPDEPVVPVFGASGGAAAYRRDVFLRAGGFAEPFFMYLEDVDLAWRLRLMGYESVWNPAALVQHRYSASAGEGSSFKQRLLARNRIWTLVRCLPAELWRRDRLSILAFDAAALGFGVATLDEAIVTGRAASIAGIVPRLIERDRIQSAASADIAALDNWIQPQISPLRLRALRKLTATLAY